MLKQLGSGASKHPKLPGTSLLVVGRFLVMTPNIDPRGSLQQCRFWQLKALIEPSKEPLKEPLEGPLSIFGTLEDGV